jgi:hypothetical protein
MTMTHTWQQVTYASTVFGFGQRIRCSFTVCHLPFPKCRWLDVSRFGPRDERDSHVLGDRLQRRAYQRRKHWSD